MTYDEFILEEKQIETNHPDFFENGKKLSDYILIVFNMRTGYKRHEWIDKDGLDEEIRNEVEEFIERLETSVPQQ